MARAITKIHNKQYLQLSFALLLLTLLAWVSYSHAAEDNPYAANYHAQNASGMASKEALVSPKMLLGKDKAADNISMLENGFDLMGSSGFDAGDVSPDLALAHAQEIRADQVLVYVKALTEKSAASRIQQLREAAKKNGGVLDEKDIADDGKQYTYFASYWVKLPQPLLGLHVLKLKATNANADEAEVALLEKGLKVIAVIKDSPAEKANILRGDVLLNIAGVSLEKPEELSKAVVQNQGKTVEINYVRDGQAAVTQATINKR